MSIQREPMTPAGHAKVTAFIKNIKEVERPANVKAIEEAIAHGDLSENAEYHAAKERQGMLNAHLADAEHQLGRAEVIDPAKLDLDRIAFGATVEVLDKKTNEEYTYQIVGSVEADAANGKISYSAPLAKALLGKEEGDDVRFKAPGGTRHYEVVGVEYK